MKISYDPLKRDLTLRERGLDFEDAAQVFADLHTVEQDSRFDYPEPRFISAGTLNGRVVVIVWTPSGEGRRVISMRHAHAKESKRWRDHLG